MAMLKAVAISSVKFSTFARSDTVVDCVLQMTAAIQASRSGLFLHSSCVVTDGALLFCVLRPVLFSHFSQDLNVTKKECNRKAL